MTHTSSYELEICLTMTHTYTLSYPRLVALQNTYFSSTFTEVFLIHACGVTRNWRTYFISVRRVFLVERVVLQTVLWDIRAWSARFLVSYCAGDFMLYRATKLLAVKVHFLRISTERERLCKPRALLLLQLSKLVVQTKGISVTTTKAWKMLL